MLISELVGVIVADSGLSTKIRYLGKFLLYSMPPPPISLSPLNFNVVHLSPPPPPPPHTHTIKLHVHPLGNPIIGKFIMVASLYFQGERKIGEGEIMI